MMAWVARASSRRSWPLAVPWCRNVPAGSVQHECTTSRAATASLSTATVSKTSTCRFSTRNSGKWWSKSKLVCATAAGSCLFLGMSLHTTAFCETKPSNDGASAKAGVVPKVTLYQYRTCPFCCKTRAYLDYKGVPYRVVEVNPLFRREVKFSEYKCVPFIVAGDGTQVNDSNLIISILETFVAKGGAESLSRIQDLYPEMSYTDAKGKLRTERANKYFIMFGENGDPEGVSLAERREEREWREWVDQKLIHTLSPNIYRTPSEALQAFKYISSVGNFNRFERVAAKYCGALIMFVLSKRLKKKYQLQDDVRESLYAFCAEWVEAVGKDRKFMGGGKPNLADLAVFGVLSAIEGLTTFTDMMENTAIGPWYWAVKELVGKQES